MPNFRMPNEVSEEWSWKKGGDHGDAEQSLGAAILHQPHPLSNTLHSSFRNSTFVILFFYRGLAISKRSFVWQYQSGTAMRPMG